MKLIFAGSGSAFTVGSNNYQSNMIIESEQGKNLLIDCGSDIRHALFEIGKTQKDIDAVYISHLHADHVGGLEWLAFTRYNSEIPKPKLYISHELVNELWDHVLSGGLNSQSNFIADLTTYFSVHAIGEERKFEWEHIQFKLIKTIHYHSGNVLCPSYGLFFILNGSKVFITTDSQLVDHFFPIYREADLIFQDCETTKIPSGVHAHYNQLKMLDNEIKNKMWLYHHNSDLLPDAEKDGFLGFVKKGQVFR